MSERRAGPEAMQKVFPDIFAWRDRAPVKEAIFVETARLRWGNSCAIFCGPVSQGGKRRKQC